MEFQSVIMSIIIDNKNCDNHPSFVINTYLIFKKNGTWHTPKYFSKYFRLTEFHEFGWWWDWFRFTYFHSIYQIMFDAAHPLVLQTANYDFFFWQFSCQNKFFSPFLVNFPMDLIIYHNLQFQELVDMMTPHIGVSKILYEI